MGRHYPVAETKGRMGGKRLRTFAAAIVIVGVSALATVSSAAAFIPREPSSFFGVSAPNFHDFQQKGQAAKLDAYVTNIQATGVGWIRDAVPWPDGEPAPPVAGTHSYNWGAFDAQVTRFAQHGLAMQPVIRQTPWWAAPPGQTCSDRPRDRLPSASGAADYGAFVGAFVQRYGRGGTFWAADPGLPYRPVERVELWNEPNIFPFACPAPNPERYGAMVAAAADAAHHADPNVVVSVGGLVAQKSTTPLRMEVGEFLRRMTGAMPSPTDQIDAVAIHLYDLDPDGDISLIGWLRSKMATAGLGAASILVTEYGWHTHGGAGSVPEDLRAQFETTFANQAPRLNCGVIGVAPHAWITAEDPNATGPESWWGIADPATGAPYPSGQAYADQVALFEGNGTVPAPRQTIPVCNGPPPDQDNDGTPDEDDDFPLDPTRSSGSGEPPGDPSPPPPPTNPPRVEGPFFGVMPGGASSDIRSRRGLADAMREGQIGTSREVVDWAQIQPSKATDLGSDAPWAELDGRFLRLGLRGVRVLPTFADAPGWADPKMPSTTEGAFADFLKAFARRYGRGGTFWQRNGHLDESELAVRDYEIWDRGNVSKSWWDGSASASEYASAYAKAQGVLHQVDANSHALVSLDRSGVAYAQFVRDMVMASPELAGHIDGAFVLAANAPSEPAVEGVVAAVRSELDSTGNRNAPIDVGFGWYTSGPGKMTERARASFYTQVANRLARSDCGVGGLLARSWVTPQANPSQPSDWYGMVDPQTFQLLPTAQAYGGVARMYLGYGIPAPRAVVHTCLRQAPDRDRDGVPDAAEAYPLDPRRADRQDTPPRGPQITSAPRKVTNSSVAEFHYSSRRAVGFWCRLDGGPLADCNRSGISYAELGPGQHRFTVRALDSLGLVSPPSRTFRWTIDKMPPNTAIKSHPKRDVLVDSVRFAFSSNERNVRFACSIDSARYRPCRSPHVLRNLTDGPHRFRVAAIDLAGNGDPTPSQFSFRVHTVPTKPTITAGPAPGSVSSPRPTFAFDAHYAARFQCRFDENPFRPCSRAQSHTPGEPLSDGPHVFEVRGIGGTGKPGPATTRSFRVAR